MSVSGSFSLHATIALDSQADTSDGVETTLSYGYNMDSGGVLLTFSHQQGSGGLGLNVNLDSWIATYMGDGCSWQVEVTDATVSGHISCVGVPASNDADGSTGKVNIELDFTADS